jgi:hypothetical protein
MLFKWLDFYQMFFYCSNSLAMSLRRNPLTVAGCSFIKTAIPRELCELCCQKQFSPILTAFDCGPREVQQD